MAKHIRETSYRSGDVELTVADKFIYEVNLYTLYPDRVESEGSRFYSSPKPVNYRDKQTTRGLKFSRSFLINS